MFATNNTRELQRQNQDLTDRIAEMERRQRERDEAAQAEREAQSKRAYTESLRTAYTWPEALEKQAQRCGVEVSEGFDDGTFLEYAQAARFAGEQWPAIAEKRQSELDALQAQIDVIQSEIRAKVADVVQAHCSHRSWASTAEFIRAGDIHNFLDW